MSEFKFKQDVGPGQWHPLPRSFSAGETIHKFSGHDYGLVRDDLLYGGFETVACTEDGKSMFTVPIKYLERTDGKPLTPEYMIVK